MKRFPHNFFFILFLLSFSFPSPGQQNFNLYNMSYVPQRMYANPALLPESRINIGLPIISSLYLEAGNSGFKYADLIHPRPEDDSLEFDFANMLGKLKKNNYFTLGTNIDLLSFGFIVKEKNYFSFNATEKVFLRFRYPRDFFEFIWNGNYPSAGETLKFNFGLDFTHYREYGLSYTRILSDKINIGGRFKYLYGMENVWTKKTDVTLYTDPTDFALTASSDIIINTAGLDSASLDNPATKYLFGSGNKGFGLDLGASYQLNEQINLSASIIDLGYIKWKNSTQNYVSKNPGASFTYKGQNLDDYISDTTTVSEGTDMMLDSLEESFEIEQKSYTYNHALPVHFYISGDYKMTSKQRASAMIYGHFFDGRFHPGISISDISDFNNWFSLIMSYSIYNRSYTNLGVGFRLNLFFLQWYVSCDNVFGMIFPQQAKYVNVRTGLNLTFGRKNKNASTKSRIDGEKIAHDKNSAMDIPDRDGDKLNDAIDECPDQPGRTENKGCPEKLHMINEKMDTIATADISPEGKYIFSTLPAENVKFALQSDKNPEEVIILIGNEEKKIKVGKEKFYYLPQAEAQLMYIDASGNPVMSAKNKEGLFIFEQLDADPGAKFKLMNVSDSTTEIEAVFKGKPKKLKRGDGGLFYLPTEIPTVYIMSEDGKQLSVAYQNEDGFFVFKNLPSDQAYYLKLDQPDDAPMPDELKVLVEGEAIKKAVKGGDNKFRFATLTSEDAQQMSVRDARDVEANIKETDKTVVTKVFQNLEFDVNSENIRSSSNRGLEELAVLMKENPSWKLKLGGHTDNVQDEDYNLILSKKRVDAVKNHLVKAGISSDRIITKHFGEKYPVTDNNTADGKQKNRRVEMLFIVSGDVKNLDDAPKKKTKGITFKVQVSASVTPVDLKKENFKGVENMEEFKDGSVYKYVFGNTFDYSTALDLQNQMKQKGYKDCFIIAFQDGKKISLNEALEILKK